MPRTNTTDCIEFTRPSSVTYQLPPASAPSGPLSDAITSSVHSYATTVAIHLPPSSTWTSGLHYHATHTEFLRVIRGRALVTLVQGKRKTSGIYDSTDGIIRVDRYVIHEWKRASKDGEEVVVQEWTDPADGGKETFFRNLNSVILDAGMVRDGMAAWVPLGWWIEMQILMICAGMDNYPVFFEALGYGLVARAVAVVILWLVARLGSLIGLRTQYEEYTPVTFMAGVGRKKM